MNKEKDKQNREELKKLINETFKNDEGHKAELIRFVNLLENGDLDNLLTKIKKNLEENSN